MANPDNSSSLPPALLARDQEAQVLADEASARKAATDADTSALTLAQNRYKSLIPDLTSVSANAVDDKSTGVTFSGLVTYSALHHAAEIIADRISPALGVWPKDRPSILVTSQSDLLTNDLLSSTVKASLQQLLDFADKVLAEPEKPADGTATQPTDEAAPRPVTDAHVREPFLASAGATAALASGVGAVAAVAGAGLGPIGLGAAAAAAIPSIISLFSSTTTVHDHAEDITDLATTTSVQAAVADKMGAYTVVHEDFRLGPQESPTRKDYQRLMDKRTALLFKQEQVQKIKNDADLVLSCAQQDQDTASKANPLRPADAELAAQVPGKEKASADAAAALALISAAITSIDAFTTAVNATAAGIRSPLAVTILTELLCHGGTHGDSDDGVSYVLSVKGLGGQSVEYTKDRHIGLDTYTTLADAPVTFMLYDLAARKIISSGIANGISSVHGHLGEPPTGLIGPNSASAVDDEAADATSEERADQPSEPHKTWWHRWRQVF